MVESLFNAKSFKLFSNLKTSPVGLSHCVFKCKCKSSDLIRTWRQYTNSNISQTSVVMILVSIKM